MSQTTFIGQRRQALLKIYLPDGQPPLYASRFRELLAKGGDGHPLLPPAFFHYDEHGKTLQGKSDIRVIGGQHWVGILSQSGVSPVFDGAVGVASRLIAQHYGQPVPIQVEAPEFGVAVDHTTGRSGMRSYYVRDLAIKRRHKVRREMADVDLIRKVLMDGIMEIADRYGFDVPPEQALNLRIHDLRCIGLRLGTTQGSTNEFVTLANAEFSMNCDLRGIWQAGSLQSRGYGRIVSKIAGSAIKTSAPREVVS